MEGEERPQKMRKLSRDHEESQAENVATKNESNAPENDNTAQSMTEENTATQETANAETAPAPAVQSAAPAATDGQNPPLSKNQLKKLRKKQEWEAGREERKVIRKEKVVAKRERKKEAKAKAQEEGGEEQPTPAEVKQRHIQRPVQLPVTIILDCDFDNLMRDNERVSLASQITRCYSDNKNSKFRAHLTISSFGGHLRERFDGLLNGVYKSWKGMRFMDEDFVETAEKEKEAEEYIKGQVKAISLKSKAVSPGCIELNYEIRFKEGESEFVNALSQIEGISNVVLVSYNGDYMG